MKYKFNLSYSPTVATVLPIRTTRVCFPLHNDDLAVSIDRADGEWYYTRQLEGNLVFVGGDYSWIMALPFDGTFTINIQQSTDGTTYYDYFSATFSRASLEIDEDNHRATLSGLKEGITDLVKNGAKEEYDLMKLIPDEYAKEVQGQVSPALAMVDYRSETIDSSDIYCGGPNTGNGYKENKNDYIGLNTNILSNSAWLLKGILSEAKVTLITGNDETEGIYTGEISLKVIHTFIDFSSHTLKYVRSISGTLRNKNNCSIIIDSALSSANTIYISFTLYNSNNIGVVTDLKDYGEWNQSILFIVPTSLTFNNFGTTNYQSIEILIHNIRATLLTQSPQLSGGIPVLNSNVLDTGYYYKFMAAFEGSGLTVTITANTSDQPNGHRMVPGSDEYGGTPQYFAPPDTEHDWIPLAEDNWNYASMWYTIQPSVANGLDDPAKFGSFRWTRCWTIGTCIQFLLQRITDGKVVFAENTDYSQFLYGNPNPVEGHEPFQWLVTQKSNVMRPSTGGASAARCPVKLEWFFELLRNTFNCYYWFEKVNGGTYNFRIEHVEYFRHGGTYTPNTQDDPPLDLTRLKPVRNFLRNGQPAKRYADQTNKYTFDLDGMVEKYTYSWQGDGGGDDFKGNPMYFRAGWIEKGTNEDHQVDNIFADLGWLMLNAGTDTASSKNYDGLFIFGGYRADGTLNWRENTAPALRYPPLASGSHIVAFYDIWLTVPEGNVINVTLRNTDTMTDETITSITGTDRPQALSLMVDELLIGGSWVLFIDFGTSWQQVVVHRVHALTGNVYNVPNVRNLLRTNTVNYLQNGCLAWPWLQCEYLHYDIPAAKWTYLKDEYTDNPDLVWETDGTIKMVKKQDLAVVPVPDASTEDAIMGIMGVKTGLGTGIIDNAKINLSSRNAEMTIIYDINPNNN